MTLGLARYPAVIIENAAAVPTGLHNWRWHSCTKTQYASRYGTDHFLTCHRAVISLLDAAAAPGLGVDVRDDSGYWVHRDQARLLASVDEWNRIVARLARLADVTEESGLRAMSPVGHNPNFERLEME